jgi:hypothetical protein
VETSLSQGVPGHAAGIGDRRAGFAGSLAAGLNKLLATMTGKKIATRRSFFLFFGALLYYKCRP